MLLCSVCDAEIYRWVDNKGHVHYSDDAKDSSKAKKVKIKSFDNNYSTNTEKDSQIDNDGWSYRITDSSINGVWGLTQYCTDLVTKYIPGKSILYEYARTNGKDSKILKQKADMVRVSQNKFEVTKNRTLLELRISNDGLIIESRRLDSEWVKHYRCNKPYSDNELLSQIEAADW